MEIRLAQEKDIPELARLRMAQLMDEGQLPERDIRRELEDFFARTLEDGTLAEWVAEEEGSIVGTGALLLFRFPPNFREPAGLRGYITNMYTAPTHRGQGIAGRLLEQLVEEARTRGVRKLWLSASPMGKPVYEKAGFQVSGHFMEKTLEP